MNLDDPELNAVGGAVGGWSNDPKDIAQTVFDAHRMYPNVPAYVLGGLVMHESNMNPVEKGAAGEEGIAQFMPETAKRVGSDGKPYVQNPWMPHDSIFGAAKLLDDTMAGGKVSLNNALRQYNGSLSNPATQTYADTVMAKGKEFASKYKDRFLDDPALDAISNAIKPPAPVPGTAEPKTVLPGADLPAGPTASAPAQSLSAQPAQTSADVAAAGGYGRIDSKLNALTLGIAPRAEALYKSLTTPGTTYSGIRDAQTGAELGYDKEHPTEALIDKTLGPVPATLLGTGLAGAAGRVAAGAVGEALPAASRAIQGASDFLSGTGGGGVLGRAASRAASGAIQGATAGALDSGLSPESTGKQMAVGAILGGGLTPAGGLLQDIIAPRLTPEMAQLYKNAKANGVTLSLRDIAPNSTLSGFANPSEPKELTALAAKTIGSPNALLTSNNLDAANRATGSKLDALYPQLTSRISIDPTANAPILALASDFMKTVNPDTETANYNTIKRAFDSVYAKMVPGGPTVQTPAGLRPAYADIPNGDLADLVQSRRPVQRLKESTDSLQNYYGNKLHNILMDGVAAGSGPDQLAQLKGLNNQYSIGKALEPAADAAGASGVLDPADVAGALADRVEPQGQLMSQIARVMPPRVNPAGEVKSPSIIGQLTQGLKQIGPYIAGGAAGVASSPFISGGENLGVTALIGAGGALGAKAMASQFANNEAWKNALADMALNGGRPGGLNLGQSLPQNLANGLLQFGNALPTAAANIGQNFYDYGRPQLQGQAQ